MSAKKGPGPTTTSKSRERGALGEVGVEEVGVLILTLGLGFRPDAPGFLQGKRKEPTQLRVGSFRM
jgi:hypothetical protein